MKSCKEEPLPDHPTDAQIRNTIEKEGERLLAQIPPRAYVVALCVEGKQMPSEAFAKMIDAAPSGWYHEGVDSESVMRGEMRHRHTDTERSLRRAVQAGGG
jgi:hypothetical protein